jgi:tRNA wybutosine-synthesizing protein 1
VEPKAYVFVGASRERLSIENMPSHETVKDFGKRLATKLGYDTVDEKTDSRVLLLSSGSVPPKIP